MFSTENPVLRFHEVLPPEILCIIGSLLTILELVPLSETCVGLRDVYQPFVISEKKKNILYLPGITEFFGPFFTINLLIITSRIPMKYRTSMDYSKLNPYLHLNGKLSRENDPAIDRPYVFTEWRTNVTLNREDGPAGEWPDGTKKWYRTYKFPREDGPAKILEYGHKVLRECDNKLYIENPENPEKREKREKKETKKHIRKLENIQKNYLNKKATTKKEKRKT